MRLSTLHLAKGLEWDAVFLPCLNERELPSWQSIEGGSIAEERRLFYVGLTRARRHLFLSHSAAKEPSRFLAELKPAPVRAAGPEAVQGGAAAAVARRRSSPTPRRRRCARRCRRRGARAPR